MTRAAIHRENLVRTAMRLFRKQGYASTGLAQILAESGAPKGSLYHYFPNGKEGLGEAATHLAGELIADMLREVAETNENAADFVNAYCETMAGWMEESGFRSGCPIATAMLETAPQSPAMTNAGKLAIESWISIIADKLAGHTSTKSEATRLAENLVAAIEGALVLARIRESTEPILNVGRLFPIETKEQPCPSVSQ